MRIAKRSRLLATLSISNPIEREGFAARPRRSSLARIRLLPRHFPAQLEAGFAQRSGDCDRGAFRFAASALWPKVGAWCARSTGLVGRNGADRVLCIDLGGFCLECRLLAEAWPTKRQVAKSRMAAVRCEPMHKTRSAPFRAEVCVKPGGGGRVGRRRFRKALPIGRGEGPKRPIGGSAQGSANAGSCQSWFNRDGGVALLGWAWPMLAGGRAAPRERRTAFSPVGGGVRSGRRPRPVDALGALTGR